MAYCQKDNLESLIYGKEIFLVIMIYPFACFAQTSDIPASYLRDSPPSLVKAWKSNRNELIICWAKNHLE
jgi:hypothetical protein